MKRVVFLILAVLLCGCEPHVESQPQPDELDEKLANYQFHDDFYENYELDKIPDSYYIVIKTAVLGCLLDYLAKNDFVVIKPASQCNFAVSNDILPQILKECSHLCIKGTGDISGIPDVLYINNLYSNNLYHKIYDGIQTNCILVESPDVEHSELIERYAEKLNVILVGPWDDLPLMPGMPSGFQEYMLVCTTASAGNCVEIVHCFRELCGLADSYIWFYDNPQPGI